jgi:hypothetical protein
MEAPPTGKIHSLSAAGITVLLTAVLLAGASLDHWVYAAMLFVIQAGCVISWVAETQPPAGLTVAGISLAVAAGADVGIVLGKSASPAPIAYAVAGGFLLAAVGQLARRNGRVDMTRAFGVNLMTNVLIVGYPLAMVAVRKDGGARTLGICLLAAGAAVAVARIIDIVPMGLRPAPEVPRALLGLGLGIAAGLGVAVLAGTWRTDLSPLRSLLIGGITAAAAVLADLVDGYFKADSAAVRGDGANDDDSHEGVGGRMRASWLASARGPLTAFAAAIPVAYVASALVQGV